MTRKTIARLCVTAGVLLITVGLIVPFFAMMTTSVSGSMGIIGGASLPTYLFVLTRFADGLLFTLALLGVPLLLTGVFCTVFPKTVDTHCHAATTALAMGLSLVGAGGLACVAIWIGIVTFHEMALYPIAYPFSIGMGMLCLLAFIGLLYAYIKARKRVGSWRGLVLDMMTAVLYLPAFFYVLGYIEQLVR